MSTPLAESTAAPSARARSSQQAHGGRVVVVLTGTTAVLLAMAAGLAPIAVMGLAALGACVVGAAMRPPVALAAILSTAAVVGTGESYRAVGVQVRLIDVVAAACLIGLLVRSSLTTYNRAGMRGVAFLGATIGALALYGGTNGWDNIRADVYLCLFAIPGWMFGTELGRSSRWDQSIRRVFLAVTAVTALKAFALATRHTALEGPGSSLQAWSFQTSSGWRTILVGGDTLLVVAPALLIAIFASEPRLWRRMSLLVALMAFVAVLLSQTRTNIVCSLAGVLLAFLGTLAMATPSRRRQQRQMLALLPPAALVLVLGGLVPDLVETTRQLSLSRFDATQTGPLNSVSASYEYRAEEAQAALATLTGRDTWIGRGAGSAYLSPDTGQATVWSHNVGVWIVLKVGLLGLVALLGTGWRALRSVFRRFKREELGAIGTGLTMLILVIVAISIAVNRVASVEGTLLLSFATGYLLVESQRAKA
jgi:hypothetical protein